MPRNDSKNKLTPWLIGPPPVFGRGGADRILATLAINGPTRGAMLGLSLGLSPSSIFGTVNRLQKLGLVVKRRIHQRTDFVAINTRLRVAPLLRKYLTSVARNCSIPFLEQARRRTGVFQANATREIQLADLLFAAPRLRILILLAIVGTCDLLTIRLALDLQESTVIRAINLWQRHGVLKSCYAGGHRFVMLDDNYHSAAELRDLLRAIQHGSTELQRPCHLARHRMKRVIASIKA